MGGNLAMNSHFENMSEKDSNDAYDHHISEQEKRERAVGFAEWIVKMEYEYTVDDKFWYKRVIFSQNSFGRVTEYETICDTTDELYDLYLLHLNSK